MGYRMGKIKSKYFKEKMYWDKHFLDIQSANNLFFMWFDSVRFRNYDCLKSQQSLEIGPGMGYFSKISDVSTVVDISDSALERVARFHSCTRVKSDCISLPFEDECFSVIYINDVLHHLKAQGILREACDEFKRVLKSDGVICISDRLPTMKNKVLLFLNSLGRRFYCFIMKIRKQDYILSGSDEELCMTHDDYRIITENMVIEKEVKWRSDLVFPLYGMLQFINILAKPDLAFRIAEKLIKYCDLAEKKLPCYAKNDVSMTMRKEGLNDIQ